MPSSFSPSLGLSGQPWEPSDIYLESLHVKRRGPGVRVSQELGFFWNQKMGCFHESLGIQSPSENGNGLAEEVIIHPNHHVTFGDWIPRECPKFR